MSLRDRLRKRHDGDDDAGTAAPAGPDVPPGGPVRGPARDDVTDFDPRADGDYHDTLGGLFLRFARPAVTETDAAHADPARGEFTAAGRFTVQRRFERPVVYTVLAVDEHALTLTVRRTDTARRDSAELTFTFEQDDPDPD